MTSRPAWRESRGRVTGRVAGLVATGLLGLGLAACGATSRSTSTTPSPAATASTSTTGTPTSTTTGPAAVPIRVTLTGQDHAPVVNKPWTYRVTVTDAQGRPLSGTETTHYTFGGTVVGTEKPTNVRFSHGVYRDTIEFPARAVGYPLAVQTVVHTSLGAATRSWPIKVRKAP